MINQGPKERVSFHKGKMQHLNLKDRQSACVGSCYVRGRLEQAGFEVSCEQIEHDFGQPVDSLEESVAFLRNQLFLDETSEERQKEIALTTSRMSMDRWYCDQAEYLYAALFRSGLQLVSLRKGQ
jgi:hypothetical protein